jgi:hypothetical protein
MEKTFNGNCASIQPPFSALIGLPLQENQVHHSKEPKILVMKEY